MSVLGTLIRVDQATLDEILHTGGVVRLLDHPDQFDLDRHWDAMRYLLDRGGAPVNPVSGGSDFPDSSHTWSYDGPARCLDPDQVRSLSEYLRATPFAALAGYLADVPALDPPLYPHNRKWLDPDTAPWLGEVYDKMVAFLTDAAAKSQYVIFTAG